LPHDDCCAAGANVPELQLVGVTELVEHLLPGGHGKQCSFPLSDW
jgi:hypothetical protein